MKKKKKTILGKKSKIKKLKNRKKYMWGKLKLNSRSAQY